MKVDFIFAQSNYYYYYNCFTAPWTVFTGTRDSEWQWHPLSISKSASRPRQISMPVSHYSVFTGQMPSCHPTNNVKLYLYLKCYLYAKRMIFMPKE